METESDIKSYFKVVAHNSKFTQIKGRHCLANLPELYGLASELACKFLLASIARATEDDILRNNYNSVYCVILTRKSEPDKVCLVNLDDVQRWRESGAGDIGIFSYTKDQTNSRYILSFVGFEYKSSGAAFSKDMLMQHQIAKFADPDSDVYDMQYVLEISKLKQGISIPHKPDPIKKIETITQVCHSGFLVVQDLIYFSAKMPEKFTSQFVITGGTVEMIISKMKLYKLAVQLKSRIDNYELQGDLALGLLKNELRNRKLESLDVQRYSISLLLWLSTYNYSLKNLIFYCEEFIYNILCQENQGKHECGRFKTLDSNPSCEIMIHTRNLRDLFNAMDQLKNEIEKSQNLVVTKNVLQKKIAEFLGPLDKVFENALAEVDGINDYIPD